MHISSRGSFYRNEAWWQVASPDGSVAQVLVQEKPVKGKRRPFPYRIRCATCGTGGCSHASMVRAEFLVMA